VAVTLKSSPALDGLVVETRKNSGAGGIVNTRSTVLTVGDTGLNQQVRSFLSFATNRLPHGAVITSAALRVWQVSLSGNPFGSLGKLVADIGDPIFGGSAALVSSDFQAPAGRLSSAVFSSPPVSGWYSANLVQAGLARISLTSNTQFRLRFTQGTNNNRSPDRVNFASGNGTIDQPQLIINYFVP
jgi:hypothetical protein